VDEQPNATATSTIMIGPGTTNRSWAAHERAVEVELSFLARYLLDPSRAEDVSPATADSAPQQGGQR
jgi:hypothetical protein